MHPDGPAHREGEHVGLAAPSVAREGTRELSSALLLPLFACNGRDALAKAPLPWLADIGPGEPQVMGDVEGERPPYGTTVVRLNRSAQGSSGAQCHAQSVETARGAVSGDVHRGHRHAHGTRRLSD